MTAKKCLEDQAWDAGWQACLPIAPAPYAQVTAGSEVIVWVPAFQRWQLAADPVHPRWSSTGVVTLRAPTPGVSVLDARDVM